MFVYSFVDRDLRIDVFFKKERAVENGSADFEVEDIGTSLHTCIWG